MKIIYTAIYVCLISAASLGSAQLSADVIKLGVGEQNQAQQDMQRPQHGDNMSQVKSQYGAPQESSTTGDPAITTWTYADFSVYFENDIVLRAVLHHKAMN